MVMNSDEIPVILSFFRTCVYDGLLPRTKNGMGRFCVVDCESKFLIAIVNSG